MLACLALAMPDVLIIAASESPIADTLTTAMKSEILAAPMAANSTSRVLVLDRSEVAPSTDLILANPIICPLTLNLPAWLPFPQQDVYAACADVQSLRTRVAQWHYDVRSDIAELPTYWLPLVLTAKGLLYAEAIEQVTPAKQSYQQPYHLTDSQRQPLYQLGHRLLRSLNASPGVYLMQFGCEGEHIWFDRLIPFPDAPAIASVEGQTPNLFACHWACLTGQPIRELTILA